MEKINQENKQVPATNETRPAVLVVEDDEGLNHLICLTLVREGFKTLRALTGAEAIAVARVAHDAIMILDYRLPDMNAMQVITVLQEEKIETPIIITTGNGDERIAVELMKSGVLDYIVKEPKFYEKLPKIIAQTVDSIARKKELARVEMALRESEARWRLLVQTIPDYVALHDREGRYLYLNRYAVGFSEKDVLGKSLYDFIAPDSKELFREKFEECVKSGKTVAFEYRAMGNNGDMRDYDNYLVPIKQQDMGANVIVVSRDITDRKEAEEKQKKLEEQLRQSQKLEAIGQLSSGVAHDFNNLLGGIMGHAELLKMELNPESPLLRHPEVIISSCEKAADLTRQLLTFARKAPVELKKIDMNAFLKQVVGLMDRTIDRRIEIVTDIPEQPEFISGDRNQLENALLNIAINARDAMPEGGHLCISSETVGLNQAALPDEHGEVAEGTYARISIADTGTGMSKEIKDRIFEPFFTTKEVGKGTGLGLASVYGCVKQHNGYIAVTSHEGKGTKFDLYFPLTTSAEANSSSKIEMLLRGKGTLLVVDDEPVYHEILSKIFSGLGYTVHCFSGGAEGVDYYRDHASSVQVVILDMNMPKISGLQCFRHLKEINPGVQVIVSSGYGENRDREALQKEGIRAFIQKPYKAVELSMKIAELVNATSGESAE